MLELQNNKMIQKISLKLQKVIQNYYNVLQKEGMKASNAKTRKCLFYDSNKKVRK